MILLFSILGALFSLGGNLFIISKKRIGWIIWILGNISWILVNILGNFNLPMVVMYIVYFIINLVGYIKWYRKDKNKH